MDTAAMRRHPAASGFQHPRSFAESPAGCPKRVCFALPSRLILAKQRVGLVGPGKKIQPRPAMGQRAGHIGPARGPTEEIQQ